MVYIITGDIDQGKTSLAYSIFKSNKQGTGFLSLKMYTNNKFIGYQIFDLVENVRQPLAYIKTAVPDDLAIEFEFSGFAFTRPGFEMASNIVNRAIEENKSPIFIDEIGPIELFQKRGFYHLFEKLLRSESDIIVVVRNFLLQQLIETYNIKNYKQIKV